MPFELDEDAIKLYYHYGFVPEPVTAVRGIRKLPAGHILQVHFESFPDRTAPLLEHGECGADLQRPGHGRPIHP